MNWLFSWAGACAKCEDIVQRLIATCRLHDIDHYTHLVDVRVGGHPAADVAQLTPALWKQLFAANSQPFDLFAISI